MRMFDRDSSPDAEEKTHILAESGLREAMKNEGKKVSVKGLESSFLPVQSRFLGLFSHNISVATLEAEARGKRPSFPWNTDQDRPRKACLRRRLFWNIN